MTIVKVAGVADLDRLRRATATVHETLGISRIVPHDGSFDVHGGPFSPLVEAADAAGGDDLAVLADRATFELNRPFGADRSFPIRLFVLPRAGYHYIGRTYRHWVGDAYSMNSLLCRVLAAYLDVDAPRDLGATNPQCPTFRRTFATAVRPDRWCAYAAGTVTELLRFRRCHRASQGDPTDISAHVRFPAWPEDILLRIDAAARRFDVTINDVVLAALAEAIAMSTPERVTDRRRDLALAAIVDLRPLKAQQLMDRMGLYLGYFNVICPAEHHEFEQILRTVHAQSAGAKARKTFLKAGLELQIAASLWPWIPAERRATYFSRHKPLAGAVTNIRVRDSWLAGELGESLGGWWRAASTGPMAPLAVSITTAAGRLTCGITSRSSGFAADAVESIVARFGERLAAL